MAQGQNAALIGNIISNVVGALVRSPNVDVAPVQAPVVEQVVANAVLNDKVLVNQLNAEAPYQSRVTIGQVIAAAGVLGGLFGVSLAPADMETINQGISAVVTAGGILYTLYGRWWPRLKPLFSK